MIEMIKLDSRRILRPWLQCAVTIPILNVYLKRYFMQKINFHLVSAVISVLCYCSQIQLLSDVSQIQYPFQEGRWLGHLWILTARNYYLENVQKYWENFPAGPHSQGGSQRQFYINCITWKNSRSLSGRESGCCCCWYCYSWVETERPEWWPFKKNKCY